MSGKRNTAGTPPKKTGTPTYVKVMMIICSLSSLYAVISKCVVWKDTKFEFICTMTGTYILIFYCIWLIINNVLDLSGTPSRTAIVEAQQKVIKPIEGNKHHNTAVDQFSVAPNAAKPKTPQFYKPKDLLEYTDEDSIQVPHYYTNAINITLYSSCFDTEQN